MSKATRAVTDHVKRFFEGHDVRPLNWSAGPIRKRVPEFGVLAVAPGPKLVGLWTFISVGCWDATQQEGHGLEFVLMAEGEDEIHAESLAMAAYYHARPLEQRLDHGHTVPIGRPWVDDSLSDHLLVALPYPLGPNFEVCSWRGGHARLLWLLPITEAERAFKSTQGLE